MLIQHLFHSFNKSIRKSEFVLILPKPFLKNINNIGY